MYREVATYDWTPDSVRLIATPSGWAKSSLYYVQEVGHFRTLSTYFTEREGLDSFLVVYTLAGLGHLLYKEKSYSLKPGDVFFIDCMEYQRYAADPNNQWEILWVHLNGGAARAYYEQFRSSAGDPAVRLPHGTSVPSVIRELIQLHSRKDYRTELVSSKLLTDLLTELALAAQELEMPPAAERPGYIGDMARLLDRNFRERWTLDLLAERFAVSKYHLAKEFKRYTGFSPGEYLINVRITKAKELLKYSDLTVSEISRSVGVEHVTHFINLFKDRVGHTPLAYRRKWQRPK